MEAAQNQKVVRPKRRNVENQNNTEQGGGSRNTRVFAGTWHRRRKPNFKSKKGRGRNDLKEENAALKAQLEDSRFQQNLFRCKGTIAEQKVRALKTQLEESQSKQSHYQSMWEAEEQKSRRLKTQLENVLSKFNSSTAGAAGTIKRLQDHLQCKTRSYEEEIQRVKSELCEDCIQRIKAVNKLEDVSKNPREQNDPAAEDWREDPTLTDPADVRPADEMEADPKHRWSSHQQDLMKQFEKRAEKLQQQLLKAQKDLKDQGDKHKEDQEALCLQMEELRAKLCTSEAFKEKNEVKVLCLEEINKAYLAKLEQQQNKYAKVVASLRTAEKERTQLQQILHKKQEEWAQTETARETKLDELKSKMMNVREQRSRKEKTSGWLVNLFN